MMEKTDVAALYLRLSKEDIDKISKGDDSESIRNQRLLLADEAAQRGFAVGEVYVDEDYSGTDGSRPAFQRLIADAKLKKFDVVLCKSQSRFTRDMEMSERYINGLFPMLGIRFISIIDHVDTAVKGNKKARQINALINEWYVEDLSENIKSVYRSKMRQGQFLGAFAVYGYQKDKADRHRLVIDEEAAEVVRKIFRYCLEGCGARAICYRLQAEGILTPTEYKKSKGLNFKTPYSDRYSGKWAQTTIKRILSNRVYIGTLIQGREKKLSYKSKKVVIAPEEEWVVIEDNHEPIIAKEDFYKVQELLRLRRHSGNAAKDGRFYPLAGKVRCRDCGATMIRSGTKGTAGNYLRCRLASKSASKECSGHNIRYSLLEKEIREALQCHINEILDDETQMMEITAQIMSGREEREKSVAKQAGKLYQEKNQLEIGMRNLYMDKYAGKVDEEMFFQVKEGFDRKMKNVCEEIKSLEEKPADFCSREGRGAISGMFAELTNEIVNDFIDYIEVGEKNECQEQEVIVHWNF